MAYLNPIEQIIAQGKFAIIEALEGKTITVAGQRVTVKDGRISHPAGREIPLTQYEVDTLERWIRKTEKA